MTFTRRLGSKMPCLCGPPKRWAQNGLSSWLNRLKLKVAGFSLRCDGTRLAEQISVRVVRELQIQDF